MQGSYARSARALDCFGRAEAVRPKSAIFSFSAFCLAALATAATAAAAATSANSFPSAEDSE